MNPEQVGNLYFLQVGEDGPIKIGWTAAHVLSRMASLQQSSPHTLRWIGAMRAPKAAEAAAHRTLTAYRVRGEWFHPVLAVRDFVAAAAPDWSQEDYIAKEYRTDLLRRAMRLMQYRRQNALVIIDALGIQPWAFYSWRERYVPPPAPATFDRIEEVLTLAERGELPGMVPISPQRGKHPLLGEVAA